MKNYYIEEEEVVVVDGVKKYVLKEVPFAQTFYVNGNRESCEPTGFEVFIEGSWWNEYEDHLGGLHYGR